MRGQAQSAVGDLTKWFEAVSAARRARDLLMQSEFDRMMQQRVASALTGVEQEQAAAQRQVAERERDIIVLAELEAIRGNRGEHWDSKQSDRDYALAFRNFGLDLDQVDPDEAGRWISRRSRPLELASYVDDWALRRRDARDNKDEASLMRLLAAAKAADPDAWRVALRDEIVRNDKDVLLRLAGDEKTIDVQSAPSLILLASALIDVGEPRLGRPSAEAGLADPA